MVLFQHHRLAVCISIVFAAVTLAPSKTALAWQKKESRVWIAPVLQERVAEPTVVPIEAAKEKQPESSRRVQTSVHVMIHNGITPGVTTTAQANDAIENSKQETTNDSGWIAGVDSEGQALNARIHKGIVYQLSVKLAEPVLQSELVKKLKIAGISPATILDGEGKLRGFAYPERGLFLIVDPEQPESTTLAKWNISEFVTEPITGAPFFLRAQQHPKYAFENIFSDLTQASEHHFDARLIDLWEAKTYLRAGQEDKALGLINKSIQDAEFDFNTSITHAAIQTKLGLGEEAFTRLQTIDREELSPVQTAELDLAIGDAKAAWPKPDFEVASKHHVSAVNQIEELLEQDHAPQLTLKLQSLQIQGGLSIAHDIAWGNFDNKGDVVPQWHQHVDQIVLELKNLRAFSELERLLIEARKLKAIIADADEISTRGVVPNLLALEAACLKYKDSKARLLAKKTVATALYDAALIEYSRGNHQLSTDFSQKSLVRLQDLKSPLHDSEEKTYRVACCRFLIGINLAINQEDHLGAVAQYEKALPIFLKPLPLRLQGDTGLLGERLVSMGVSYWNVNRRKEALTATRTGKKLIESAIEDGFLTADAVSAPLDNLAQMLNQIQIEAKETGNNKDIDLISTRRNQGDTIKR